MSDAKICCLVLDCRAGHKHQRDREQSSEGDENEDELNTLASFALDALAGSRAVHRRRERRRSGTDAATIALPCPSSSGSDEPIIHQAATRPSMNGLRALDVITRLQRADGSWAPSAELAAALKYFGANAQSIEDGPAPPVNDNERLALHDDSLPRYSRRDLWCTACVIAVLERYATQFRSHWALLAAKAHALLSHVLGPSVGSFLSEASSSISVASER